MPKQTIQRRPKAPKPVERINPQAGQADKAKAYQGWSNTLFNVYLNEKDKAAQAKRALAAQSRGKPAKYNQYESEIFGRWEGLPSTAKAQKGAYKQLSSKVIAELQNDSVLNAEEATNITKPVSYTHLRAHETKAYLVCRLLLEK